MLNREKSVARLCGRAQKGLALQAMTNYGSELNAAIFEHKTELALQLLDAKADPYVENPDNGRHERKTVNAANLTMLVQPSNPFRSSGARPQSDSSAGRCWLRHQQGVCSVTFDALINLLH